jgi:hypothetical protein
LIILFSLLALFAITGLPSGVDSWWDGFPWSQRTETFLWAIIIPFFLIIGRRFLSFPKVAFFLFLLLLFKVFLALNAPAGGWSIRIYETPEAAQKGVWEKTYTTLWKKGVSDILSQPYNDFYDFPMEWLNRYNDFPDNPNNPETKRLKTRPVVQIWGFANLPPNSSLALAASGLGKGSAQANDMNGRTWDIPILENSTQIESINLNNLPKGKIKVTGELYYGSIKNPQWSLCPIIIGPGEKNYIPFNQGILWQTEEGIHLSQTQYVVLKILAKAIDISLVLFLLFWCGWIVVVLWKQGLLDIAILLTACSTIFLTFVLKKIYPDPLDFLSKGIVIGFIGLIFFGWRKARGPNCWEGKTGVIVLLTAGIGLLSYFSLLWRGGSGKMTLFSMGDDWLAYQNYARHIILNKDFWHSQNPILAAMPFYRYIVALFHVFFGQSVLSLKFLDVWSVIAASAIIASLGRYFKLSLHFALLGSLIYLFHELGDRFSYWIGSGLQEHVAMFFLMLTCWILIRAKGLLSIVYAGLVASIGFWLRFDHFFVIGSTFFLRVGASGGSFLFVYRDGFKVLKKRWKEAGVFLAILFLSLGLVFFRNWIFGGQFVLISSRSLNYYLHHSFYFNLKGIFTLLSAYTDAFSWSAVTLWSGTVIGIIALFVRVGPLQGYPISLGLILFCTILPYFLVWDTAYPPRMSVHLLPLASLSISVFLYHTWHWIKLRNEIIS